MRLINLKSRQLEEVPEELLPWYHRDAVGITGTTPCKGYVILSHTWAREEISFAEYMHIQEQPLSDRSIKLKTKSGWAKIDAFLTTATEMITKTPWLENVAWAWVDTCCIDKTSSSELSEAINSMYRWYSEAAICFAHLEDFDVAGTTADPETSEFASAIFGSAPPRKWLTRGWTLQELICPSELWFFDKNWRYLGYKTEPSIQQSLVDATKIPEYVLNGTADVQVYPVAQRMRWASNRQTTRIEDAAYCLMGLFDINMPLLYGEGSKAFLRLQEAIIAQENDHTILTWVSRHSRGRARLALASSVDDFEHTDLGISAQVSNLQPNKSYVDFLFGGYTPRPYHMTNNGLQMQLPLAVAPHDECPPARYRGSCRLALLDVIRCAEHGDALHACIYISQFADDSRIYVRAHVDEVVWLDSSTVLDSFDAEVRDGVHHLHTEEVFLKTRAFNYQGRRLH